MKRQLGRDTARYSVLTPRERVVMGYVAMGKPNKIIAAELGVSQRTVEAHRARVFRKMQVRNAVELACRLMSPDPLNFHVTDDPRPDPVSRTAGQGVR